jgi:hypothetical protein
MIQRSAANTPTTSLWLSDVDVQLIQTIATFKYMSTKDVIFSHFAPSSLTYGRKRLSRLSGGADHVPNQYLYRFTRPHTEAGRSENIFVVGTKGWDLLAEVQGVENVDGRATPYRVKSLSYSFLQHALLLTRFVVAATLWSRRQTAYALTETLLSYELCRQPALTSMTQQGQTVSVIPDAFLCFERVADGTRYPLLFEADCGTEPGRTFRAHARHRLAYLQSPQYEQLAKTSAGRICYLTIGQHPRYKHTRRAAMQRFTQDVLAELEMTEWASVFLFASVDYTQLFQAPLFDQPVWYHPDSQTSLSLLPQ